MVDIKRFGGLVLGHHLRRTMVVNPHGYSPYTSVLLDAYATAAETQMEEGALMAALYDLRNKQLQLRFMEVDLLEERLKEDLSEEEFIEIVERYAELRDEVRALRYG